MFGKFCELMIVFHYAITLKVGDMTIQGEQAYKEMHRIGNEFNTYST
jgi:hypothetical protein